MKPDCTRRHLIHLGTAALTTSIAGCVGDDPLNNDPIDDTPREDTETDGTTKETPDAPFNFPTPSQTLNMYTLPQANGRPNGLTETLMDINHPDNTLFSIEVPDSNTATATLEKTTVKRDFELRLYIRNANRKYERVTTTLEATDTDTPKTHTAEFDLSNIDLPRDAGSICELVGVDSEFKDPEMEFIIKRHQFVGVTHKDGTNWVNSEHLNHTYRRQNDGFVKHEPPKGVGPDRIKMEREPAGYVEAQDGETERTVFLVTRTPHNGELFGVSCHVNHEPIRKYNEGTDKYRWNHDMTYECTYATHISHLKELAQKTDDIITKIGVTDEVARLGVLGDMVQMIPYGRAFEGSGPPSAVLYEMTGDCSTKAGLFSGIVQNDPWNRMPAFIDCEINSVRHWTIGLDANNLNGFSEYDSFLVSPTSQQIDDGHPNTEYAFFDMTYDSTIGERRNGVEDVSIYDVGNLEYRTKRTSDDPPNY